MRMLAISLGLLVLILPRMVASFLILTTLAAVVPPLYSQLYGLESSSVPSRYSVDHFLRLGHWPTLACRIRKCPDIAQQQTHRRRKTMKRLSPSRCARSRVLGGAQSACNRRCTYSRRL